MAVRTSFTAGEVLAAADLTDTFGSKPTKTTASSAPGSPATGDLWFDTTTSPAIAKFWDGSAWQTFSAGAANFSNTATGTYSTGGVNYKYITFTGSGTLTVTKAGFADMLVVGGGASGGCEYGGGGGAGGHLYVTGAYLNAGSVTVTVGAGAAGVTLANVGRSGNNGVPSKVGSYFAPGGGAGAGASFQQQAVPRTAQPGFDGASGGSSSGFTTGSAANSGSGVSGIGNNAGSSIGNSAGGGGGAGAVGANGSGTTGGAGGAGDANSITGTSLTRGGGGGGFGSAAGGAGGTGGGGAGATGANNATTGTANSGGGGGGCQQSNVTSGAGGSGVVIIRVRTN